MIQRIQTAFLIIATILLVFVALFPLAELLGTASEAVYELSFKGLLSESAPSVDFSSLPLSILIALCLILTVVIIFLFKKRMIQIRLCIINIVLLVGLNGLMLYYVREAQKLLHANASYSIIFIFPLVSAILVFLALRAIARDEALIRSLDRLR